MGAYPRLRGHDRSAWLIARLQGERLRQLHFQFLLGRIDLAVRAMDDPQALAELRTAREHVLNRFRDRYMATPSPALYEVLGVGSGSVLNDTLSFENAFSVFT